MTKAEPPKTIQDLQDKAHGAARAGTASAPVRRRRTYLFYVSLLAVTAAFGVLTFLVKTTPSFPLDLSITTGIQSVQFPLFGALMLAVSWPGFVPQSIFLSLLMVLLLFGFGLWWETISAIIAAVLSTGVNLLVKDLIQRPRPAPDIVHVLNKLTDFSFPSGHVMYYVCFGGFIVFLLFTLLKPSLLRALLLILLGVFIALVGISRIYEGEHWASDVLGAYLLGFLCLVASISIYRWGKSRFFVRQPVARPETSKS
jgi:membrane-associated phospholipid phosphatase